MSTTTLSPLLTRLEGQIARSECTTAFLQVQRLQELIRIGEEVGAITIDGYPASHAQIALNVQIDHYMSLCRKHNVPCHL